MYWLNSGGALKGHQEEGRLVLQRISSPFWGGFWQLHLGPGGLESIGDSMPLTALDQGHGDWPHREANGKSVGWVGGNRARGLGSSCKCNPDIHGKALP